MSKKDNIRSFIYDYQDIQFNKEPYLERFIEKHSSIIFDEEISWRRSKVSNADLEGEDSDKNIVIVEVKKWKVNSRSNMSDQEHSSIGQIIRYAKDNTRNHTLKTMRLFIVGDLFSRNVAKVCKYLRKQGFNICHISIRDCIEDLCGINTEKEVHTANPEFNDTKIKAVAEDSWDQSKSKKKLAIDHNLTEKQIDKLRATTEYQKVVESLMFRSRFLKDFKKWIETYSDMDNKFGKRMGLCPKVVPEMVKAVYEAHRQADIIFRGKINSLESA